jgi:hypothetical protein
VEFGGNWTLVSNSIGFLAGIGVSKHLPNSLENGLESCIVPRFHRVNLPAQLFNEF